MAVAIASGGDAWPGWREKGNRIRVVGRAVGRGKIRVENRQRHVTNRLKRKELRELTRVAPGLDAQQREFCLEYCVDLNAADAARRIGIAPKEALYRAIEWMRQAPVRRFIDHELARRCVRLRFDADEAMSALRRLAFAEIPSLVEIGSCRRCWGDEHRYQYRNHELAEAKAEHLAAQLLKPEAKRRPFDDQGGGGFDATRPPFSIRNGQDHNCPNCDGRGLPYVFSFYERDLSPEQRQLFNGIEFHPDGTVRKIHWSDRTWYFGKLLEMSGLLRRAPEPEEPAQPPLPVLPESPTAEDYSKLDESELARIYRERVESRILDLGDGKSGKVADAEDTSG